MPHCAGLFLGSLLALAQASAPQPTEEAAGEIGARVDAYLQRAAKAGFHGSILVLRGTEALLEKGYGLRDRDAGLANGPDTVHAIGSITKQFTAAAILKLEEQGKLSVQDPIAKHLPGVPEDKSAITLHHLLTHSAGFPGAIGDDYAPVGREEFVELAMQVPLGFAPGTGYAYSNVGYSLLGAIVERVSGQGYERFLKEELLDPAGLRHTGYKLPDWSKAELAVGYDKRGERWGSMLEHPWAEDGPYWHLRCNGGLLSTNRDMLTWLAALRSHKVLGVASVEKMFTPHVAEGEGALSHYGYGWALFTTRRGTRLITHNGGNGVQFADLLCFADEDLAISLMSNASPRGMQDLAWEVGRMVLEPGYEPRLAEPARKLAGLPAGASGERLRGLSALIASAPDDAALGNWLRENLGPGFLEQVPMERHVEVFRRLCNDIGEHRIEAVEQEGPEDFLLHLRSGRDAGLYVLHVQLRPADARIGGLAVERG